MTRNPVASGGEGKRGSTLNPGAFPFSHSANLLTTPRDAAVNKRDKFLPSGIMGNH